MSSGSTDANQKTFLKTILIYLFLLGLAYAVADLALLKWVRPQFMTKISKKHKVGLDSLAQEPVTGRVNDSDIGSMDSYIASTLRRNMFNSKDMPLPLSRASTKPNQEEVFTDADPVLTSLQLKLDGTAVHRNPFRSLATVSYQNVTKSYSVGDRISTDAEVVSVLRKKVIFRNLKNRRLEYAEISRDMVKASARPVLKKPSFRQPVVNNSPVRRDGNRFSAKRSDVNKYLNNYQQLLRQANSRPATDPATGEFLGYEIFAIQPGSLYEQLGLKNGDVISSVNGTKIRNPGQAMGMFQRLKNASDIRMTINRGGREEDLEYSIEE